MNARPRTQIFLPKIQNMGALLIDEPVVMRTTFEGKKIGVCMKNSDVTNLKKLFPKNYGDDLYKVCFKRVFHALSEKKPPLSWSDGEVLIMNALQTNLNENRPWLDENLESLINQWLNEWADNEQGLKQIARQAMRFAEQLMACVLKDDKRYFEEFYHVRVSKQDEDVVAQFLANLHKFLSACEADISEEEDIHYVEKCAKTMPERMLAMFPEKESILMKRLTWVRLYVEKDLSFVV